MNKLTGRLDFIYLFDVMDGNPNGDPGAGNLPRVDAETGIGLVTDVCLKRKVRNYVDCAKSKAEGYDIFIREKAILNDLIDESHESEKVKKVADKDKTAAARQIMCEKYYDVRTFGAVMSTGKNAGQVRGPIQFTFARSIDPIFPSEHIITRVARTKEKSNSIENQGMGRKSTVPYGLYRAHGFISANLAKQTGFSTEDLDIFFEALKNMFDMDRSAARGLMSPRKLIVFRHESELGNAPAHTLFDRISVKKADDQKVARSFEDYIVEIDRENLPQGVTIEELI